MKHVNVWPGAFRVLLHTEVDRMCFRPSRNKLARGGTHLGTSLEALVSSEELARHSYPRISSFATVHQGVIVVSGWESFSYWFIRLFHFGVCTN